MKNHFLVKLQFILYIFLISIDSAGAKELQCSLNLASNNYFVNVTPLSDQTYRAVIVESNNLTRTFNLIGQYQVLESGQSLNGNKSLVYKDRQRQFALYIQAGASFVTATLNNSSLFGEKLSGPLICQIIKKEEIFSHCCSLCNPNCLGSGLPACPIRPGSCH